MGDFFWTLASSPWLKSWHLSSPSDRLPSGEYNRGSLSKMNNAQIFCKRRNYFSWCLLGPGGVVRWKKLDTKMSWHYHFKLLSANSVLRVTLFINWHLKCLSLGPVINSLFFSKGTILNIPLEKRFLSRSIWFWPQWAVCAVYACIARAGILNLDPWLCQTLTMI